jgi:hypothetical protein
MSDIGIIMLRHVKSKDTNKYWVYCYKCIRKFYPENKILIIDDNSNYKYITNEELYKTRIIKSEYPGRGELLPYLYYLQNKDFETALIIHDSVFINKKIDLSVNNYKILWNFEHKWDQIDDETKMIEKINNEELTQFYKNKNLWEGCYGGMSIITHDYLTFINNKYDIRKLLDCIKTRYNRCSFERVLACLLQKHCVNESLFGNIHKYCRWGMKFHDKDKYDLPFIKVWVGR